MHYGKKTPKSLPVKVQIFLVQSLTEKDEVKFRYAISLKYTVTSGKSENFIAP